MNDDFDLDAYFARIGWGGTVRRDLATVASVLRAHMARIPFENLDVLLGRPIRLDVEGVQRKLVQAGRGGYCFEHGTLLAAALESMGLRPRRHLARVTMVVPRDQAPRTHMFLTIALDEGSFVLDPGFGSLAPRVPVPFAEGETARIGDEAHELVRDGPWWVMRAHVGGKTVDAWASTMEDENLIDFELGNHFTSTHPSSPFVNRLTLRALTDDGRVTVMNRDVTVWRGTQSQAIQLADRDALRELLLASFGIDLPEVATLRVPSIPEWA
jgi:N-hydroxyarylamine O-acetyltransferase